MAFHRSSVRFFLLFAVIASLWNLGGACTPGHFSADPDVCNQYYLCVKSGAATINILQKCSDKQNFDPNLGYCTTSYNCLICD